MALETWNSVFQSKIAELRRPGQWTFGQEEHMEEQPGCKQYMVHTSASFRCSVCGRRWESSKVRIIFHIKQASRRVQEGRVTMRIFKQECKKCQGARLEEPQFLIENIDVTLEQLVTRIRKVCYREDVSDRPVPAFLTSGRTGGPHDSMHCEACRLGLCDQSPSAKKDTAPIIQMASTVPAVRTAPVIRTAPAVRTAPTVQTTPAVRTAQSVRTTPRVRTATDVRIAPNIRSAPAVQTAPSVPRRITSYDQWDDLMERGYPHLRDADLHTGIPHERRLRDEPKYAIRGANHPSYRSAQVEEICCQCVLL
ncbi:receptor-transporting protein 3-like isoform X2 [Ambystoma mexicanum]|uniref:receptor-transporting protein 3-like isoform X2 n=1 Tax=Ambystoma mexicanum TaxID=8296 RepID=UPI0037E9AD7F